jgi:hypothetical protein
MDPDACRGSHGHGPASDGDPDGVADHGPDVVGNRRGDRDARAVSPGGWAERGNDAEGNTGAAALVRA